MPKKKQTIPDPPSPVPVVASVSSPSTSSGTETKAFPTSAAPTIPAKPQETKKYGNWPQHPGDLQRKGFLPVYGQKRVVQDLDLGPELQDLEAVIRPEDTEKLVGETIPAELLHVIRKGIRAAEKKMAGSGYSMGQVTFSTKVLTDILSSFRTGTGPKMTGGSAFRPEDVARELKEIEDMEKDAAS
jgi:hypothetical protein